VDVRLDWRRREWRRILDRLAAAAVPQRPRAARSYARDSGRVRDGLELSRLAGRAPSTIFDVVSGTNSYSPKVRGGGFRARRGYDLASGLGVSQFAALAAKLPEPGCRR
jgi:hypothetical protein